MPVFQGEPRDNHLNGSSSSWESDVNVFVIERSHQRVQAAASSPHTSAIHGNNYDSIFLNAGPSNEARRRTRFGSNAEGVEDFRPPPLSTGSTSYCDINDVGDTLRLNHRPEAGSTDEDHVELGTSYEDTLQLGYRDESTDTQATKERNLLQQQLIQALVRQHDGKEFLPLGDLDVLITEGTVRRELSHEFYPDRLTAPQVEECVRYVCDRQPISDPDDKHRKFTSGQRVFAILIMIEKLDSFLELKKQDLRDINLPLSEGINSLKTSHGEVHFDFQSWSPFKLRSFDEWQWKLLAPYFSTSDDGKEKVLNYELSAKTVFPWIAPITASADSYINGGQGGVTQVNIHPSHHNFRFPDGCEPCFAVKRLHSRNKQQFDKEVNALKRFSSRENSNLVQLLATYRYKDEFYLLFPWADGNLRDLWQNVEPPMFEFSYDEILWMAEVCHGIAAGLSQIHKHETTEEIRNDSSNAALSRTKLRDEPGSFPPDDTGPHEEQEKKRRFGRHGDIKPENVLWFKTNRKDDRLGVLKISDFGLTKFHTEGSKSEMYSPSLGFSHTYRAPEIDLKTGVGQHYDIWTLGCLYLEFISWFLLGWDYIDTASRNRTAEDAKHRNIQADDEDAIPEDNFFLMKAGEPEACLKQSVINWMDDIHAHPRCTEYIHEFVDLIENRMLLIDKKARCDCSEIVITLSQFLQNCKDRGNTNFYLRGVPRPRKPRLELSDVYEVSKMSQEAYVQRFAPKLGYIGLSFVGPLTRRCLAIPFFGLLGSILVE